MMAFRLKLSFQDLTCWVYISFVPDALPSAVLVWLKFQEIDPPVSHCPSYLWHWEIGYCELSSFLKKGPSHFSLLCTSCSLSFPSWRVSRLLLLMTNLCWKQDGFSVSGVWSWSAIQKRVKEYQWSWYTAIRLWRKNWIDFLDLPGNNDLRYYLISLRLRSLCIKDDCSLTCKIVLRCFDPTETVFRGALLRRLFC